MTVSWVLLVLLSGHVMTKEFPSQKDCKVAMIRVEVELKKNVLDARCIDETNYGIPA